MQRERRVEVREAAQGRARDGRREPHQRAALLGRHLGHHLQRAWINQDNEMSLRLQAGSSVVVGRHFPSPARLSGTLLSHVSPFTTLAEQQHFAAGTL